MKCRSSIWESLVILFAVVALAGCSDSNAGVDGGDSDSGGSMDGDGSFIDDDDSDDGGDFIGDTGGDVNSEKAIVGACFVESLHVGVVHFIQCHATDPLGRSTDGQWSVTSEISGLAVTSTGKLETQRTLESVDVGEHEYTVRVLDSDGYSFIVPIDEHKSTVLIQCPGESEVELLLPERIVEYFAILCGEGFLVANKPSTSSDPDYILEVRPSCIPGIIESLSDFRKEMLTHYEDAMIMEEIYGSCTPESAWVKYHHD